MQSNLDKQDNLQCQTLIPIIEVSVVREGISQWQKHVEAKKFALLIEVACF